ncbi:hypothetical protein [Chitinibacter sp. GC72]|uniref:hypothetical protein n=1 Tax=Chitinibacter sp. GC72 TaxID=1526917 RepID=UPI0012F82DC2|nr:hypothetical protein [Chitinibacter sp. GC72]
MPDTNYIEFIGKYFGEPELGLLIDQLEMTEAPKIPRGNIDAYLQNHSKGIELTSTDENGLDIKTLRQYPEGVLVLSNIRFYGSEVNEFNQFEGQLPMNLIFGEDKADSLNKLTTPVWINSAKTKFRWDFEGYCLGCYFNAECQPYKVCIQLPIK